MAVDGNVDVAFALPAAETADTTDIAVPARRGQRLLKYWRQTARLQRQLIQQRLRRESKTQRAGLVHVLVT